MALLEPTEAKITRPATLGFYEFFAGGGMARLGLGKRWTCLLANDFSDAKCRAYKDNFGDDHLINRDIAKVKADELTGLATLAWASFPCQDLSLAGNREGLEGGRSGTFWTFWDHIQALKDQGRPIPVLAIENVVGLLSTHGGADFRAIVEALSEDYNVGGVVMDAVRWLPQSRPRLVIVAVAKTWDIPNELRRIGPNREWHPSHVTRAHQTLSDRQKQSWVWWNIPVPEARRTTLADVVERNPTGVSWDSPEKTEYLLSLMTPANLAKVEEAKKKEFAVGTIYRRTRPNPDGTKSQRAEVRFDGVSGCLRTPSGGSSRQTILIVGGEKVLSRLLSPREAARLMGLPEHYKLPSHYNEAYHLAGDGVAVPVVAWLSRHLLTPLAEANSE